MEALRRFSEVVYIALSFEIGTDEHVSMRRDMIDLIEEIENKSNQYLDHTKILSGSSREGFRLAGSDRDYMIWPRDVKVICDLSQRTHSTSRNTTLILMESAGSRPGFVLLNLLTPSRDSFIASSCVRINDKVYISSSRYRHAFFSATDRPGCQITEHGPCVNIEYPGTEFDYAFCFSSEFWPPLAAPWIQRCHSWPSPLIRNEIIRRGCNFIPIGNSVSFNKEMEWRLSFSKAENQLVYALNHCQFLVYGLLKLFLKEVITQCGHGKLLCSYFMKTAVFWEIQENSLSLWCPQNIVFRFWACFKRLMKWVYEGYCPNFFVQENNMFLGKICGTAQNSLFRELSRLYDQGVFCLLHCHSLRRFLYSFFCQIPRNITWGFYCVDYDHNVSFLVTPTDTSGLFNACNTVNDVAAEIALDYVPLPSGAKAYLEYYKYLQTVTYLFKRVLTKYQRPVLHLRAIRYFIEFAFNMQQTAYINREMYITDRFTCHMLKTVSRCGSITDMLYLAMYFYRTSRYTESLSVLDMLDNQFVLHNLTYNGRGILEKYIIEIGGRFLLEKFKDVMIRDAFTLYDRSVYINELALEQKINTLRGMPILVISPVVMLRMLYVLCYNHIDVDRRQQALYNLYTFVHSNNSLFHQCMSYQILGICQEICGQYHDAIISYSASLRFSDEIKEASIIRIKHASQKLGIE